MRLDRIYIDGFKNLKQLAVDFDESKLTTVLIGQNGAGKSNLIEAIARVFRWVDFFHSTPKLNDLNSYKPNFTFSVDYRIEGKVVTLSNEHGKPLVMVNGKKVGKSEFEARKSELFPDLVFGYYSGGNRRLESVFDKHQQRYYNAIKLEDDTEKIAVAQHERRLFFCRPVHGTMALASIFAFPADEVMKQLKKADGLKITGFHSMLNQFREPWFSKNKKPSERIPANFWGAAGPAGRAARQFQAEAFHPMALEGNAIDDYRDKQQAESQYATFLPSLDHLKRFARSFKSEREMFYALESLDISDLIREMWVWITRSNDPSGDVSFADLSDGERQLLMVLGLIRVSRGRRALFLLDEPDTHLNPHWQHNYLKLIEEWAGIAADVANCHIILTSHNPLTISALTRDEVRVMATEEDGRISVSAPYADPKGLGFTATLTEIFNVPTSLDVETQRLVDERNELVHKASLSHAEILRLEELNYELGKMGFLFDSREPLYKDFLKSWQDLRYADRKPLSPEQTLARRGAMKKLLKQLMEEKGGEL